MPSLATIIGYYLEYHYHGEVNVSADLFQDTVKEVMDDPVGHHKFLVEKSVSYRAKFGKKH